MTKIILKIDNLSMHVSEENKETTISVRMDGATVKAFRTFCKKELNVKPSTVLRTLIKQICKQNKYLT